MEGIAILLILALLILEIAIIITFFRMAGDISVLRRIFEKKFGKLEEDAGVNYSNEFYDYSKKEKSKDND